jgi:FADH2 O2-dependent halogenase
MSDVIIIGGGPAGSTLACYLSLAGIDTLLLEQANHPRPHVGESLVTSTYLPFKEIGFIDTMEEVRFVRKYGAAWHALSGKEFSISFSPFPKYGIDRDYIYHVDRSKFDHLLIKHAEKLGAKVVQGVRVRQVLFDDGNAVGVRAQVGETEFDLHAKLIVDASGRHTLLGRQLGIKENDPIFDQYAVHAWFKGLDRGATESADYIHIYFLPVDRGWAWQIPITDEITSVGIVAERDVFRKARKDVAEYFDTYIHSNPALTQALAQAERINEFKTEGDYSYVMKQFVGDHFMMVGDAARFVDPIFSSGVSVAMMSARFATEHICRAFQTGDFSRAALQPCEDQVRSGVSIWYEFIRLYYKLLPLFTHFIQSSEYKFQIKELLQGLVFDRSSVPVLDAMREYIRAVEASDNHIFKSQLSSVPID